MKTIDKENTHIIYRMIQDESGIRMSYNPENKELRVFYSNCRDSHLLKDYTKEEFEEQWIRKPH